MQMIANLKPFHWTGRTLRRGASMLLVAATLATATGSTVGYAQQTMNAQPLTPESIALSAAELGPEWSQVKHTSDSLPNGTQLGYWMYSAPSGRVINLTTAVAPNPDYDDAVINYLRYGLEGKGMTISSVQSNGFGDGRAFRAQVSDSNVLSIVYMFRVRNLLALINYAGAAAAGDVDTQAVNVARKQEGKFFAVFAPPPPPTPTPTAAPLPPAPTPTPAPTVVSVPPPATVSEAVSSPAAPYCQSGEKPQFVQALAALSAQLGARMGNPTSCQYSDPSGSGDTLQTTDTGLAIYRARSATATFTDGSTRWALVGGQVLEWTGDSLDPPDDAEILAA
jgi:hypothetical protein